MKPQDQLADSGGDEGPGPRTRETFRPSRDQAGRAKTKMLLS